MYNNDSYEVLGILLAKLSGVERYEEYIINNVVRKMGMERGTFYKEEFLKDPDHITGYGVLPGAKELSEKSFPFGKTINSAGGLMTSANEMLKYAKVMLNKGKCGDSQLISSESVETINFSKPPHLSTCSIV